MSTIHDALKKAKQNRATMEEDIPPGGMLPPREKRPGRRMTFAAIAGAGLILLALAGLSWFKGTFTKAQTAGNPGLVAEAPKDADARKRPVQGVLNKDAAKPADPFAAIPKPPAAAPPPAAGPEASQEPEANVKYNPEAEALYEQALAAQVSGDLSGAEQIYMQSLAKDPSFEKSLNNLGVILMGRGQNGEARRDFLTAIRQNPAYADPYYNLACLSAREQSLPQALAFLRQAVHLDPAAGKYAKNDPDLAPLSGMEEFVELVQPVSAAVGANTSK